MRKQLFLIPIAFIFLLGCSDKFKADKEIRTNCKAGSSTVKKLLIVGWDGVRSDALVAAETPNLDALIENSIYTLSCDRGPHTVSVPGWSTILHGVWPNKHNLKENSFRNNRFETYPDVITILKNELPNLSATVLANWDDFLRITDNEDYAQRYVNDKEVTQAALGLIDNCSPDVLVLHYDFPDYIGHSISFSPNSIEYLNAIEVSDFYLGQLMEKVLFRETNLNEEWMVVITTDHGGEGTGHGGQDDFPQTRKVWAVLRFPNQVKTQLPTFNSVDILPTITKWFSIIPENHFDGIALN